MESYEYISDDQPDPFEDGLLEQAQQNGLVASGPGHLIILSHSDFDICVTAPPDDRIPAEIVMTRRTHTSPGVPVTGVMAVKSARGAY
ncbi:hypothetical protein Acor_07280 [Acrocarpospora corrugata]|uniref:Uncharacterized protein n=1 Tax=Acrocarpospora corrugata TaxID=35763 RepID=A0A5M3VPF2_9ACTN|nr:hypothetical protein Acor_07280 [Acrocarpospora corrugata]